MIRLLKSIWSIPAFFRKCYKKSLFKRNASFGKNLEICSDSICHSDGDKNITIGDHCRIFAHIYSQDGGKVKIGDHTCIYLKTVIGSVNNITIGNYVIISNHVHIYDNNNHPTSPEARKQMCIDGFEGDAWQWKHADSKPIVIEDNVWIGEYAMILKGVTVGEGSIVAAHAVVTKDVPPYSIVAGNPARVVKKIEHDE